MSIYTLDTQPKKLERKQWYKPKESRRKAITKIRARAQWKEIETMIEFNYQIDTWKDWVFFENG